MENALMLSQTIFFSIFSLVLLAFFAFLVLSAFLMVKIFREVQGAVRKVRELSEETKQKMREISNKFYFLSIVDFFISKLRGKNSNYVK